MRHLLLIILLALSSVSVANQHIEAAINLLVISGVKNSFDESEKEFYLAMKREFKLTQKLLAGEDDPDIGKKTVAVQDKMLKELGKIASEHISWSAHKDEIAQIYTEAYTLKELHALTQFYQSDIGKKLLAQQDFIDHRLHSMRERISMSMRPAMHELMNNMKTELEAAIAADISRNE